ncbi:hypothetical protein [Schlesneria paludicola]|uniref:hypothetical protein n=1 Tax=Schlesneria paludicola TaxID=360056 RepID=UPI000299DF7C|nr:hypothetical protein [Schlesneria paludicola]
MNRSWLSSILMYLWLTIGFAMVHVVIALWGIAVVRFIAPDQTSFETIRISKDGEPIIQTYANRNQDISFRRMDGSPIVNTLGLETTLLGGISLTRFDSGSPADWRNRIDSFHDFQKPATSWYLVVEPNRNQTAYFIGYQARSRTLVGFIGIHGFSSTRPPESESFRLERMKSGLSGASVIASQKLHYDPQVYEPSEFYYERQYVPLDNADPDLVWLFAEGTLYEIHLGDRSVRTIFEDRSNVTGMFRSTRKNGDTTTLEIFCRANDELLQLDPQTRELKSMPLAPAPAGAWETMYKLPDGRKVFVYSPQQTVFDHPEDCRVVWIKPDGLIEREVELKLHGYHAVDAQIFQSMASLVCPAPIVAWGAQVAAPIFLPQEIGKTQTYLERSADFAHAFQVWLATSTIVGLIAGWACRRREVGVFHNKNWFWPILIGISGWFGWVGYIFMRPLPARLPDGSWLPKEPTPAPPLGIEIFA